MLYFMKIMLTKDPRIFQSNPMTKIYQYLNKKSIMTRQPQTKKNKKKDKVRLFNV